MSVYGQKILTENMSLENICNEMNILCLEVDNFDTFMNDFIFESDLQYLNEGFFDVIGKAIKTLKDNIVKFIKWIGECISNLFKKKSNCKKEDKVGEELIKDPKNIKPKSNNNNNSKSSTNNNNNSKSSTNNNNNSNQSMKKGSGLPKRSIEKPGTYKYHNDKNPDEYDELYTQHQNKVYGAKAMSLRNNKKNTPNYHEYKKKWDDDYFKSINLGTIFDPKYLDEKLKGLEYYINKAKNEVTEEIMDGMINKTSTFSTKEYDNLNYNLNHLLPMDRYGDLFDDKKEENVSYYDFINFPKDKQKRILTKSEDYTDKITKLLNEAKKLLSSKLKYLKKVEKKIQSFKYEYEDESKEAKKAISEMIKGTQKSISGISKASRNLISIYLHIKKQQIKVLKVYHSDKMSLLAAS